MFWGVEILALVVYLGVFVVLVIRMWWMTILEVPF